MARSRKSTGRPRPGYFTMASRRRARAVPPQQQAARQFSPEDEPAIPEKSGADLFRPPSNFNFLFPRESPERNRDAKDKATPFVAQQERAQNTQLSSFSSALNWGGSRGIKGRTQSLKGLGTFSEPPPLPAPLPPLRNTPLAYDHFSESKPCFPEESTPFRKGNMNSVKAVKRAEISLSRFLAKNPDHTRAKEEFKEYERCKTKVDQNIPLTSAEKSRMNQIARNIERREYTLNKDAEEISSQQHTPNIAPVVSKAREVRPGPNVLKETVANLGTPGISSPDRIHLDKAQGAAEASSEDDTSSDGDLEGEERPFWRYNVYLSDSVTGDDASLIATYLNKSRAEARVGAEISRAFTSSSLADWTGVEVRCVFQDGAVLGQTLEFDTGRKVQVQIDRELIKNEVLRRKQRKKLECLPSKLYVVSENVVALDLPAVVAEGRMDGFAFSRHTDGQEVFTIREDANEQASREMLEYMTNHLPPDQKFDLSVIGKLDTEARLYLHELEESEGLYDRTRVVIDQKRRSLQVSVKVKEMLVRGPIN
ncbi:predicted protein [Uncinocarpus reesii 1704]|uniref:Uncharacterized protein n=1 Tax=Uncinocarpus reesii (strain UAMH 1704) TaxID=336963 RepID=C4JXG3_UNCRE|nr:uncharacterized protein UREG_06336 [Uncinocarpus reesii 1704]EEP81471.1 predicted protein [Uncinocarpus reesii 1704]